MSAYINRRVLFMIPKIFAILVAVFVIVQFAPGGPVARVIAKLPANAGDGTTVFRVEPYSPAGGVPTSQDQAGKLTTA